MNGNPELLSIAGRAIGDGRPCFVIAEAGSNHNGSYEQALALIDVAADAGADAVKFQFFKAGKLYPRNAGASAYLGDSRSIYEIIREMELPDAWVPKLAEYCRSKDVIFLCSPFDEESTNLLDPYVDAFKIASYEMTHLPLVRHVARKGKPVIVSTGTANLEEVGEMVEVFLETGNRDLALLQCTAKYPAPLDSINLRAMRAMRHAFGVSTGLSDHSREALPAPMAAAALGAHIIEKHFTLSNRLPGPDHRFAVEPHELKTMIQMIRQVERVVGTGLKQCAPEELELRSFARRSVFSLKDIATGEVLDERNIGVLRSGNAPPGLPPSMYEGLLGRVARKDIACGKGINFDDLL